MQTATSSGCTPELYRSVMGCFPTGVTVITVSAAGGARVGVTASSFNTVSMDPPLILWSLSLRAPSLTTFRSVPHFAVNVLAEGQDALARHFARPSEDKFAGIATRPGLTGAPLIEGALAHIECRVAQRYAGGDHEIMLGEVVALSQGEGEPLVFRGGRFCRLAPH
ncbi:MAG: flavin reductase family protein [Rhodobacteraceae bacterium]|nr:flavin reductase family protein [Paracoccaceae bacterium]